MDFISLFDLNNQVKNVLKERFTAPVWVAAEIAAVLENHSGHCYLELVDKPEGEENPTAVARGTIWAFTYRMLKPYFETTTGRTLEKGMKVLIQVEVVYHELYGLSLNVKDIDPTFTVGDVERKKRMIIEQLEQEGIIDMNRNLELPLLPKNVAVISSPTAAGLGDFLDQLENNSYGYKFHVRLFPAVMQGERTSESVIAALDRIYAYEDLFDVVVIIRGGGAQSDLGSFDTYDMAANVAQFPLPVIAGIGHERDETVVDRVAYRRVKTPTAAAAFLIETFQDFDAHLEELKESFLTEVQELIAEAKSRQHLLAVDLKRLTQLMLDGSVGRLRLFSHKLKSGCGVKFDKDRHLLEVAEIKMKYVDPENVLKRGYSITRLNGKAVFSAKGMKAGDVLETVLADGQIRSVVTGEK
ncbi:exodeoxyribonuclease VII large subunit [Odoribacter lunatus]|uniref:exodeoxyribonuclease VII large subunit n=1 Tax=Odoribacter lunatus TaxID=2941335 RepID=UPI00203E7CD4|nr:exodeoxyribonuclease VII large subunit [Odoribacter lunatus]